MNISLIIMLSLPVLYLTGSLRRILEQLKIGGAAFVIYFFMAAALCAVPVINVLPLISVNLAGLFVCIAPTIYIAIKKQCGYRFLLASNLMVLLSALSNYLFLTFTMPVIKPVTGMAIVVIAICCLGFNAAPKAPALAGVFTLSENIIDLLTGQVRTLRLFDSIELAMLCFLVCFCAAPILNYVMLQKQKRADASVLTLADADIKAAVETMEPELEDAQQSETNGLQTDENNFENCAQNTSPIEPKPSES